ncbi:hypothetical protein LAZ67_5002576 [Cordylochernes scorpioides]|uniref:Uncharacterized protein n=1 Tax=Cordylochernes scorpioides TaxID=51811 RepID=A0ABY6KGH1_9ARAC|nr:hypothetical protein LAZ67_5002576 [Cordylochernes scorpioides]
MTRKIGKRSTSTVIDALTDGLPRQERNLMKVSRSVDAPEKGMKLDIPRTIASIETLIKNLAESNKEKIRTEVIPILKNLTRQNKTNINHEERKAISFLKKNNNIINSPSDKDNKVVEKIKASKRDLPIFYGLPKIHKPNNPLRPIVSYTSSPNLSVS